MSAKTRSLPDCLRTANALLQPAIISLEATFLDAGQDLAVAVDALQKVTAQLDNLTGRLADRELEEAIHRTERDAAKVSRLASDASAGQASLDELAKLTSTIGDRIARLRRIIGEVHVLGINAKVEAAHVTASDIDFTVFTREIGRLAILAGEGLEKLANELVLLGDLIERARSRQESFSKDNRDSLATFAQRIEISLVNVRTRRQNAVRASTIVTDRSAQITRQVSAVVGDLQIADSVRQRIEHVQKGITEISRLGQPSYDDTEATALQRRQLSATLCQLEAAQLIGARDDFQRETDRIIANLEGLAQDSESLRQQGLTLRSPQSRNDMTPNTAELGEELQRADAVLSKYAESRNSIEAVVQSVSARVAAMVEHVEAVHSIEADMRVMGLNATLKCGRLGSQGRALSIIAQELRAFANRTAEDSGIIMRGLQQLIDAAESLSNEKKSDDGTGVSDLVAVMSVSVRILTVAEDELNQALAVVENDTSRAAAALTRAVSHVTGRSDRGTALGDAAEALLEFPVGVPPAHAADLELTRQKVRDTARGRYTMASERSILNRIVGDRDDDNPVEVAASADIDDMLF